MSHHYLDPAEADNPRTLPTVWVTWFGSESAPIYDEDGKPVPEGEAGNRNSGHAGYYACFCLPGCLPDSDWSGPFESEEEALTHMRETYGGES